ncbi:uncharacterized protein MONBRDRAFT_25962 [Monosiga brevicollis MX1]|uniref:Methylenetetrahydrofolate dehydrogenase n=1 Tax=Monosiga brevicollis TaxID=81824 RepID=A9V0Z3_MONBE|nr:uncharacterized protein MONBRDRAFT_25962 [Monosiga brevicollis MX1]EDQ88718.1 predicted protein [Monosiga brevicollis MX1]|eukprot:XP_001746331.1 hypothetical protein [Monosiga brevicollis MX1]
MSVDKLYRLDLPFATAMSAPASSKSALRVNVTKIAEPFREHIRHMTTARYETARPKLLGILANDDPAAKKYAEWTGKACRSDGIDYELDQVEPHRLEDRLAEANQDPSVHGIIIYYPVFGSKPSFFGTTMDDELRDKVDITKDVEGLTRYYREALYRNQRFVDEEQTQKCVLPCTPLAVVKILEDLHVYNPDLPVGDRLRGKSVTVINRSEVVGRPLAAMLANDGAQVFSVDIDSIYEFRRGHLELTDQTVESACRRSDVIILGVPSKDYQLPIEYCRDDVVIVNVASFRNIDEEALAAQRPNARFVPMVGKHLRTHHNTDKILNTARHTCTRDPINTMPWETVTVAMLERNVLRLYENFHSPEARQRQAARQAVQPTSAQEQWACCTPLAANGHARLALVGGLGFLLGVAAARIYFTSA